MLSDDFGVFRLVSVMFWWYIVSDVFGVVSSRSKLVKPGQRWSNLVKSGQHVVQDVSGCARMEMV
jgi:hypothetical protein